MPTPPSLKERGGLEGKKGTSQGPYMFCKNVGLKKCEYGRWRNMRFSYTLQFKVVQTEFPSWGTDYKLWQPKNVVYFLNDDFFAIFLVEFFNFSG